MSDLISIGYPEEFTATLARNAVTWPRLDRAVEPEATAAVACDGEGAFHVTTSHHAPGRPVPVWGMFLRLVFVSLFSDETDVDPHGLPARVEDAGVDSAVRKRVRDLLLPGTSGLLLILDGRLALERAVAALVPFGGIALRFPLREEGAREALRSLHGEAREALRTVVIS